MSRLQQASDKAIPALSKLVATTTATVEDLNEPSSLVNDKGASGKEKGYGCMIGNSIYVATGSKAADSWIKFEDSSDKGFVVIDDDLATSGTPVVVLEGESLDLVNSAALVYDDKAPLGFELFRDNRIQLENVGDECLIRVTLTASSSKVNGGFYLHADIGDGSSIKILSKPVRMLKGANQFELYTVDLNVYARETFIANGAKITLSAEVGNIKFYDLSYYISKK